MKLEHLIQAYKFNNIEAEVKDMSDDKERAGTITYGNGISSAYLLDDEEIVISLKMFFNCLTNGKLELFNQLDYTLKILNIIQKTIILLSAIPQKECNMILDKLGLFDETFKEGKQIKHLDHVYKIEVVDGLLCLSINEIELKDNEIT